MDPQNGTQRARKGHKEKENKKIKKVTTLSQVRGDEPDGFDEWYASYPRKVQRKDAAKAYRRVVPDVMERSELLKRTRDFATYHQTHTNADRWHFIPYPASWLNKGGYLDAIADPPSKPADTVKIEEPTRDPSTFTEREWRTNLTLFESSGTWSRFWGPRPGDSGCLAPSHLLHAHLDLG